MAAITWQFSQKPKSGYRTLNVSSSATGSAQTMIAAPGSGSRIVIDRMILTVDAAAALTVYVTSNETGNRIVFNDFAQYGGILQGECDDIALPENAALLVTVSTGNVKYVIFYHLEPVR